MNILSWNIQWGRGADGRVDLARTVAEIRRLGGAQGLDVICLQEVACNFDGLPGGAAEDGLAILTQAFADHEAVFGAGVDVAAAGGGRARFGNLILSRLPVDAVFRHLLPAPLDAGLPAMQRVCVEAVLGAPWGPLRVMTTHLEYYSARQRLAQARALCALQAEVGARAADRSARLREGNPAFAPRPRPAAAVLCGDFNCEPDSEAYRALCAGSDRDAALWCDGWRALYGDRPHTATVGLHGAEWPDRAYCCDYFMLSPDLCARLRALEVAVDTAASDHQPLCLSLAA